MPGMKMIGRMAGPGAPGACWLFRLDGAAVAVCVPLEEVPPWLEEGVVCVADPVDALANEELLTARTAAVARPHTPWMA
jgi:hypothetical protein